MELTREGIRTQNWAKTCEIQEGFSSVTQSCPTLHDPTDCSKPGFPVHHQLLELTQIHVHPIISFSVIPFSSHLQSVPASGSFPMSQFFVSGGQSIGVSASASVLPMNLQDLFLLGWTSLISLLSKGLSRVFSNTTVQKHQFIIHIRVFMRDGSGAVCSRREAQSMQRPWGRASSEGGGTAVMQKYLETEWRRGRTLIKTLLEGGCWYNRVIETTGKTWPLTQSEMGRYWRIQLKAHNSGCWFTNTLHRQQQKEVTYWKDFATVHGRADSKWAPGICSRGAVFWREIQILLMDWMQTVSEREKWKVNPRFSWPEQPRGWVCPQLWCGRRDREWE